MKHDLDGTEDAVVFSASASSDSNNCVYDSAAVVKIYNIL
jgi:hypothetical protein